jgi:hypothetical protein
MGAPQNSVASTRRVRHPLAVEDLAMGYLAVEHRTTDELQQAVDEVRASPRDDGVLAMIVRRPAPGAREVLEEGLLDPVDGLVGDSWSTRGSSRTDDGRAHPGMQVTLMNVRAAGLVAVDPARRPLAGDQLYVDLDLSGRNLPAGTRLTIGSAVVEITAEPHRGCAKFAERFGRDAVRFVNSPVGRELNLRGVNARVLDGGRIAVGDVVRKVREPAAP